MKIKISFVVNANSKIGFGHLKRCFLIANEFLLRSVEVTFISFDLSQKANDLMLKKGYDIKLISENVYDAKTYLNFLNPNDKNLLIIDTDDNEMYNIGFQKELLTHQIKLMYITIKNNFHFLSHYVLNQNIIALTQNYSVEAYSKLFLGPDYFILDDELEKIKPNLQTEFKNPKKVLVTFGSADPGGVTLKIMKIIEEFIDEFDKVDIIIGGLNPKVDEIKKHSFIENNLDKVKVHVDTNEMYKIMSECNLAITSVGLTFWELILHKVPSLVISGSQREKMILDYFKEHNYCYYIGDYDDKEWFNKWSQNISMFFKNVSKSIELNELYQKININGKTKLVKQILSDFSL